MNKFAIWIIISLLIPSSFLQAEKCTKEPADEECTSDWITNVSMALAKSSEAEKGRTGESYYVLRRLN